MFPLFIVGCGDVGQRLAARWLAQGGRVSALARSEASAARLQAAGIETVPGDLDRPDSLRGLDPRDAVLIYLAPPPASGESDPRMGHLLDALGAGRCPQRFVYLSTSGVYGPREGAWVDESTPPEPQTERARRRLDAETRLRRWADSSGVPWSILRVGGIYGPGRLPRARLEKGLPVLREAECGYTNRIHVDDLVNVCLAAAERGQGIYNVSDDEPGTMTQYFKAVAAHLGLPPPPELSLAEAGEQLSSAMLSYLTESRRLDNRRLREELGVRLRYINLAAGLAAIPPEGD